MNNTTDIDDIAAQWVVREDRGPLPQEQADARDAWLASDPRHRGAYMRAHAVFLRADRAAAAEAGLEAVAVPRRQAAAGMRWLLPAALAATLAVCAIGIGSWLQAPQQERFETAIGEVMHVNLDDGSHMVLNSATEVVVHFSARERRVELLRGETLVDVEKDPSRPFLVRAGSTDVVAVGTSFSVRKGGGQSFEVVVTEGIVDIHQPSAILEPMRVRANYVVASRQGTDVSIQPLASEALKRRLSWRDGLISFEGDTLADAALEFARFSDVRILIDDPEIASRRVVGVYASTDPEGFAKAVADSFGYRVESVPQGIYLRAVR